VQHVKKQARKILIAAGGTGGHIFPALAFGRWMLDNGKAESVIYMSGNRPLELEIYASHNVEPYSLDVASSPLAGTLWSSLIRSGRFFFRSIKDTRAYLRRERPDMCFLFGSYVSFAPLLYCKWLGIPTIAHEQNACSGKVTRLAARLGVPVTSGWGECWGVSGAFHTGVPVRSLKRLSKLEAASALGVKADGLKTEDSPVIGVIGGSLGSAPLTALIEKMSRGAAGQAGRKCLFVVLGDEPKESSFLGPGFGPGVEFIGKHWDLAPFYSLCDAVVCRAGASTLAELAAFGIPALTIPWRGAVDAHQEANARIFSAKTGYPVWIEEKQDGQKEQSGFNKLEEAFEKLLELARKPGKTSGDFTDDSASSALWNFAETKFLL